MKPFFATLSSLVAVLFLIQANGCSPRNSGTFAPTGYSNKDYHYQVAAMPEGELLPSAWKLDNYYLNPNNRLVPKTTNEYVATLEFDLDGNGSYENKETLFTYDLRYKHLVHDGVIFLRTIPVSADMEHKKLESIMDRYVEGVAGAGYELIQLSSTSAVVRERRYAATVVERANAQLAGLPAHVATLDVANVDQLQLDPNARKERVRIVLLHTNFKYKFPPGVAAEFPVIMLAGYANQPAEFEAGLADFNGLLSRIVIDGQQGFVPPTIEVKPKTTEEPVVPPVPAEKPVAIEESEVEGSAAADERAVE